MFRSSVGLIRCARPSTLFVRSLSQRAATDKASIRVSTSEKPKRAEPVETTETSQAGRGRGKLADVPVSSVSSAVTPDLPLHPTIAVVGVGGAGGNTVNNMIARQFKGVEFLVANTDAQALAHSLAINRVQLGKQLTGGLGAGAKPTIGAEAAQEGLDSILEEVESAHMVFVTSGMGGGTGTGAAPVIARAARERGALTVGIVTKPFSFEGRTRMRLAEEGIKQMEEAVDTLIVIPNQKLLSFGAANISFADAFKMVDNVLYEGVRGVTDLIVQPGLINLDFADVKSIMQNMGRALMGTGEAEGSGRAKLAAEMALHNPLLEDVTVTGATGVLISISGGQDLTLAEVDEIANTISNAVDPDANIIFGSSFDDSLTGKVRVSVIITGMDPNAGQAPRIHAQGAPKAAAAAPEATQAEAPANADGAKEPRKRKTSSWFM